MSEAIRKIVAGPSGDDVDDLRLSVGVEGPRVTVDFHKPTSQFSISPGVARRFAVELVESAQEAEHGAR